MTIKMLLSEIPANPPANARYDDAGDLSSMGLTGKWVFQYTHEGCVIRTGERNGYDDSDFYAVVWDAEAGMPREVEYATTRGWTYANSATVDATPEVMAEYNAWMVQRAAERDALARAELALIPDVGKTVEVIKGRKVKVGTVAEVVWYGVDKFNSNRWVTRYRVGLMVDGQRVFTSADNVKVI